MTISYTKFFDPLQLTTTAVAVYAMPASPEGSLLRGGRLRFTNIAAGPIEVTAYHVVDGDTAADDNAFVKAKVIATKDYLDVDVPILAANAEIWALASANTSIVVHMLSGSLFS